MSRTPSVVIIGAGVGGLTLALALGRLGIEAVVLEQSAEFREVGAAVALAANATRALRTLGLGESLALVSTEPARMIHRDGRDGRVIAATPGPGWYRSSFGAPFFALHRAALQRLLADAVGPEHLHLECRAQALEERRGRMRVHCSSGAVYDADVVVGADGVHSLARAFVTGGDTPVYSGTSAFRGLVPIRQLSHLPDPDALQFWMGPGAHLLHFPVSQGSVINFLAVVDEPEQWRNAAWTEAAAPGAHLRAFAGWHAAVTELISAVPQSPRWGLFALRPLTRWSRGPVVLLGDAAHAMLPHQGQGANQAIEDAFVLAEELSVAGEVPTALSRYASRRRVRTRQIQLKSWAASAALHLPDGASAWSRDADLARLPHGLAWIHGYDVRDPDRTGQASENGAVV
jgi:salicylate hydroxylase